MSVMIPTNLDLKQILLDLPRFKNRGLITFSELSNKNNGHIVPLPPYYYIIYSVFLKDKISNKDIFTDDSPVHISMQMVKKITGNTSYLLDLIDAGIIERYGGYTVGSHSYSYRFTERYKEFDFGFKTYTGKHSLKLNYLRTDMNEGHIHALDSLKHLEVNEAAARKIIKNINNRQSKERQTIILNEFFSQKEQELFEGAVGEVSGRLFYFPTYQTRKLRSTWSMGGHPVAIFDVKSCQPALLFSLYPNEYVGSEEWTHYKKLIESSEEGSGFYEYLSETIYASTNVLFERNRVKITLYKLWFGNPKWKSLDKDILDMRAAFYDNFPLLSAEIDRIKMENHAVMAARLQSLESGVMFDKVVTKCKQANIPCLTIHDSIVCHLEHGEFVRNLMYQEFSAATHLEVTIDGQHLPVPALAPTHTPCSTLQTEEKHLQSF